MHEPSQTQPVGQACRRDENCPWQWPRRVAILFVHTFMNATLACLFVKIVLTALLP